MTVTFRLTLVTFGKLIDKSAKEEVIHAKVVSAKEEVATSEEVPSIHAVKVDASAKEEVATSEEVPPIHAVKPSPVAGLRGRQP